MQCSESCGMDNSCQTSSDVDTLSEYSDEELKLLTEKWSMYVPRYFHIAACALN